MATTSKQVIEQFMKFSKEQIEVGLFASSCKAIHPWGVHSIGFLYTTCGGGVFI